MSRPGASTPERRTTLAAFLRDHRERVITEWEEAVRALPRARSMPRPQLINYIPSLVDRIAELVQQLMGGEPDELEPEQAERHALDRLEDGFDLPDVILELSLLRDCIVRLWHEAGAVATDEPSQHRILNQAVDRIIVASGARYTEARNRILRVLDHVSSTAMEATSLEGLLQGLATGFYEEVPAVDTVAFLLIDDGKLTVRAASGIEEEIGLSLRIGEGFAGKVAAQRRAFELTSADRDPLVVSEALRSRGIHTLYGLPLIDGGDVMGVAHMGSRTARHFSNQDRVLFRSMISRATAAIHQRTLRDRAERRSRELEESEKRFRATFDNAAVGIAHVSLDGRWLRLNDRYCDILGYSHDELTRLRFQDLTHPDDLRPDLDQLDRLLAGELDGYRLEKRYLRKDGRVVWVELAVSLVRNGTGEPSYIVAAVQDISAQRELRDRLAFLSKASELLGQTLDLQQTVEQVAQLLVPTMADWCGVDVAAPGDTLGDFFALAHRDPAKVDLGRKIRRRYPLPTNAPVGPPKVLRTGEPELIAEVDDATLRAMALDRTHLDLLRELELRSLLVVPLLQHGRVFGSLSLATAESARTLGPEDVELAQELARRASAAIENAQLHADTERAVLLREQILAIVSHDLRDPIGTIDMSSNLLLLNEDVVRHPAARKRVEAIQRNAHRASRLIKDLLDVSSIQSGKLTLELQACEIAPLVTEAVEAYEPLAEEKGIALYRDLHIDGQHVRCDRFRLLQVLSNLIGNALKFCRSGDAVTVRADVEDGRVVVAVADTGPGIASEEVEHVFDVYWKGRREQGGTGLGLFIAKGIIESHAGRIWVQSRPGEGSTFFFTVPLSSAVAS